MRGYGSLLIWLPSPLLSLSLPLSSFQSLSPQAQYNESRIDSASRCPADEMIGFGIEARAGLGSQIKVGWLSHGGSYVGHYVGGSAGIRINIPTSKTRGLTLAQHALQGNSSG